MYSEPENKISVCLNIRIAEEAIIGAQLHTVDTHITLLLPKETFWFRRSQFLVK
jgi:hypothetical protein